MNTWRWNNTKYGNESLTKIEIAYNLDSERLSYTSETTCGWTGDDFKSDTFNMTAKEALEQIETIDSEAVESFIEEFKSYIKTNGFIQIDSETKQCHFCLNEIDSSMRSAFEGEWCPYCGIISLNQF